LIIILLIPLEDSTVAFLYGSHTLTYEIRLNFLYGKLNSCSSFYDRLYEIQINLMIPKETIVCLTDRSY